MCALQLHPDQNYQPDDEEVQENVHWEEHRKGSEGQDAREHQQEVRQEVDGRRTDTQLVLVMEEEAQ